MAHQKPSQSRDTIPCSRADLIDRIVADAGYAGETESSFRSFCEILIAYVHHRSHVDVERMKRAFESVDPFRDAENSGATDEQARVLMDELSHLMSRANYQLLSNDEIKAALNKASIIPVETAVDFDQFADFRFYFRTRKPITLSLKRWFRIKEITVETYDRMLVMLNTSETLPEDTVEANAVDRSALRADSVYLSYFKNIPHHDLELLFPNIEISMKLKDRLILGVPAVGAAIPLVLKILPSLGLIVGAIALAIFGFEHGHSVAQDTDKSALYALMTAFLSVSIALGGFAAQQYLKYKSKRLTFLKKITDTLFFKTLDVGRGVIHAIADIAEEVQCKEMILAFYHLNQGAKSESALDVTVEAWLLDEFGTRVSFDTKKALSELEQFGNRKSPLIHRQEDGMYRAESYQDGARAIDSLWDNEFNFAVDR